MCNVCRWTIYEASTAIKHRKFIYSVLYCWRKKINDLLKLLQWSLSPLGKAWIYSFCSCFLPVWSFQANPS
jgi:hypothetical protein